MSHLRLTYSGINTDEEGVRHVPRNAMDDVLICGMAQEIAAEKVSGLDAVAFRKCGQVVTGKTGLIFHRDDVAEPGGIGVLRGPGKDEGRDWGHIFICHYSRYLVHLVHLVHLASERCGKGAKRKNLGCLVEGQK